MDKPMDWIVKGGYFETCNPPLCVVTSYPARPNGIVEKITGTPPHTFRNFAHRNANAWKAAK